MAGDFSQIAEKMRWANEQIPLIQREIVEYIGREPYVTFIEDKPERNGYQITARLHEAVPPRIGLLAGDFLNNAHGVLDYLAWQLVIHETKRPGKSSNFPILLPNEDGTLPSVQIPDAREKPAISSQAILDALDAVQPYQDGQDAKSHPLYILKVLNRETKHRHLPLLVTSIPNLTVSGLAGLPSFLPGFAPMRFKDEEQVKFSPYMEPPNPRMPKQYKLGSQVAVEQISNAGQPGLALEHIVVAINNRLVEDVIPRFEPLF